MDLSQYRVLVVDDVPLNQLLVEKMLSRYHFTVHKASNGLEAMREILVFKPNIILLDIMMPVMDGFEVIRKVRENPAFADIKIVVLSALNTNDDILKAYSMGAQDFITKPIVLDKLTNSVAKQLGIPLA
ncbi:MAG: response regulator [Bacteroidales bacterium]|nr:response regulator [Bacteroidales bacterium]